MKFYSSTTFCSSHGQHTCVADKKKGGCFDDCYPSAEILTTRPAPALSHAHAYSLDSASLSLLGEPLVTSGCASDAGHANVIRGGVLPQDPPSAFIRATPTHHRANRGAFTRQQRPIPSSSYPSEGFIPALLHPTPSNTRPNTPPPEPLPTPETKAPKRRIQANPNPVPPAMRASANTCHDLLVIGPQRQNPCCRTLAFTCADARCPSSPGSHDFGPPAPASWYNGSPKNPPARRPAVPSIRRERPSPNQNPWPSLFTQPRPTAPPLRTPTTKPHLVSRINDFSTYPPHNALPQTRQNKICLTQDCALRPLRTAGDTQKKERSVTSARSPAR